MENTRVFNIIRGYYVCATQQDKHFMPSKYRWVIGMRILDILTFDSRIPVTIPRQKSTIFNIPIVIDYSRPDTIRLWKDVTDEL